MIRLAETSARPCFTPGGAVSACLTLVLSLAGLAGCVTPADPAGGTASLDTEGRVVERSKPEAPAWTTLAHGRIHSSPTSRQYVELRTRLLDLPLGLKQAQLGALEGSRTALVTVLHDQLADQRASLSPEASAELARAVEHVAFAHHERHAKISDIYFEKVVSEAQDVGEYFNAFILVSLPSGEAGDADSLMTALKQRLGASVDPELRSLGETLAAEGGGDGLSH